MLTVTKHGKVGFQKYTRCNEADHICLDILSDVTGMFHRRCYDISSVPSLQSLASNAIARSFKNIINETVQVMLKSIEVGGEETLGENRVLKNECAVNSAPVLTQLELEHRVSIRFHI